MAIGRKLLVCNDVLPQTQDVLLGFHGNEAVTLVVKAAEFRVVVSAYPAQRLVDDVETGDNLADILQARMVSYVEQPEGLHARRADHSALATEFKG